MTRLKIMWKRKVPNYRYNENKIKNRDDSYYWVGINSGDI